MKVNELELSRESVSVYNRLSIKNSVPTYEYYFIHIITGTEADPMFALVMSNDENENLDSNLELITTLNAESVKSYYSMNDFALRSRFPVLNSKRNHMRKVS